MFFVEWSWDCNIIFGVFEILFRPHYFWLGTDNDTEQYLFYNFPRHYVDNALMAIIMA